MKYKTVDKRKTSVLLTNPEFDLMGNLIKKGTQSRPNLNTNMVAINEDALDGNISPSHIRFKRKWIADENENE